ncbi:GNAT family N-acetyltransferase [Flavobacterium sp. NRK F7]|uniref:GNAT family N-acetyltransferase n=1 Tax=Flavobacterium sp. NRK F7 TaxID=2954930 RepID=UPI00209023A1|nr:GNAT family N-acetyltransferase [Flavobacterium sp. NRK F7]MCO6162131.1 GNAT family N-acetyltransferase [Flavobacterium sp. NRK F7]
MSIPKNYLIKRLEEKDFFAVKTLFFKVFNKKVSINYLKNKYDTSYLGIQNICSIAYFENLPVAFYGALPQQFANKEKTIFVAHACDSFTLKEYQGQGLHFQLAKFSYEIMKQENIKFVYAFHSENTYHSTKKLDWKEHLPMQRYHIKIPTIPFAKMVNKLHFNFIYSYFFKQKPPIGSLEKINTNETKQFQQVFNDKFISYKNKIQPHYFMEDEGCLIWFKIEAIIHVGIFYAPSEFALKKTIQKLKTKAFFLGINEILFQVDSLSKMALQLNNFNSSKESWLIGYLNFDSEIEIKNFTFSYSNLDTY